MLRPVIANMMSKFDNGRISMSLRFARFAFVTLIDNGLSSYLDDGPE
jgi:hypothetical protein